MRKVAVVGVGITRFGELWNSSLRNLTIEAGIKALNDAGVPGERVDALYTGCMSGDMFIKQGHIASLIADYGGLLPVPSTRVESACASGGLAVRQGLMAIASGMANRQMLWDHRLLGTLPPPQIRNGNPSMVLHSPVSMRLWREDTCMNMALQKNN